ncbi:MAG: hypothetical protein WAO41_06095 [Candidatus Nanopelagicales bacterium]
MAHVVVLFNLRDGVRADAYENWARTRDMPTVRDLPSVQSFRVFAASGLLGGGASPYDYIEVIEVTDIPSLGSDVQSPQMQQVAAQFAEFADSPLFVVTQELDG